jgi:hypothetical protein
VIAFLNAADGSRYYASWHQPKSERQDGPIRWRWSDKYSASSLGSPRQRLSSFGEAAATAAA